MKHLLLVLSLVLSSCGGSSSSNSEGGQEPEANFILRDAFEQQSDVFTQGENINFFLVLTNSSSEAITLNFTDCQQYDFYISSPVDNEVWRWSVDEAFCDAHTKLVIQAGESVEVSEIWNQQLANGGAISIGDYSAFGSFLDQSAEVRFDFAIQ